MREKGKEDKKEKKTKKGMQGCIPLHENDCFNLGKL